MGRSILIKESRHPPTSLRSSFLQMVNCPHAKGFQSSVLPDDSIAGISFTVFRSIKMTKALTPWTDGSGLWLAPQLNARD